MPAKTLTEAERHDIVSMRLDRVPVRDIAATVGCNKNTVTAVWSDWLDETSDEHREPLERRRSEVIARLDHIAAQCCRGAIEATDPAIKVKYLSEERRTLVALASVAGYDAPIRVAPAFPTMTDEEARKIRDELPPLSEGQRAARSESPSRAVV